MSKPTIRLKRLSWDGLGRMWEKTAGQFPFGMPVDVAASLLLQSEKHIEGVEGPSHCMAETRVRKMDAISLAFDAGMEQGDIARACRIAWGRGWVDQLFSEEPRGFEKKEPLAEPKAGKN